MVGGAKLVMAGFYFWNSGSQIQMSQEGLFRSLLHQALRQCEDLIPRVFPGRWETYTLFGERDDDPWTRRELERALELLIREGSPELKFCFFVDGLDGFEGKPSDLIKLFKRLWSSSPQLKFCLSSRPWVDFEDAFRKCPSLILQDLTYPDIIHFAGSSLHAHGGFAELKSREPHFAANLVKEIAKKSSGVFLWVELVVQSLLAGLAYDDRISDLEKRLHTLPADLDDLFTKILDNLDPFYREHSSQVFQLVRAARSPLSLLCLYFADEEDPEFYINCEFRPLTHEEKHLRAETMRRRTNHLSKGLLEVPSMTFVSNSPLNPFYIFPIEELTRLRVTPKISLRCKSQ
jgi:hypothetical protein